MEGTAVTSDLACFAHQRHAPVLDIEQSVDSDAGHSGAIAPIEFDAAVIKEANGAKPPIFDGLHIQIRGQLLEPEWLFGVHRRMLAWRSTCGLPVADVSFD